MKAFADHPSPEVQFEVFEALTQDGARPHAHQIKSTLRARGIQVGDALVCVHSGTTMKPKEDGVAADLLDEHSVLEDMDLAKKDFDRKTSGGRRSRAWTALGLPGQMQRCEHDYQMFSSYGRVYPATIVPDAAGQARLGEIANAGFCSGRSPVCRRDQPRRGRDEIYDEIDTLTEEADELQTGVSAG